MHAEDNDRLSQPAAKPAMMKKLLFPVLLLALLGAGAWYWWSQQATQEPLALPPPAPEPVAEAPAVKAELPYPILEVPQDEETADTGPDYGLPDEVPALEASDAVLNEQAALLFAEADVWDDAAANELLSKFVGTIYALAEGDIDYRLLPLMPPEQKFSVKRDGQTMYIAQASYQRYTPYADAFAALDIERALAVYRFFWPLLDELFAQFGEPNKTLHGEFMQALELLLQTPEPAEPLRLMRPAVYYQFADPALEALPGAQKQLLRMGPENTQKIKSKLRELQQALSAITETRVVGESE